MKFVVLALLACLVGPAVLYGQNDVYFKVQAVVE